MKARALALVALLLLPLVPSALAASPEPRAWSGYSTVSETAALALARDGTTIAVALKAAVTTGTTTPAPGVPGLPTASLGGDTDLVILDHDYGWARNTSVNPPPAAGQAALPQGRSHVAVSRDGTSVATLGVELGSAGGGGGAATNQYLRLYYARVERGGNWSGTTPAQSTVDLGSVDVVVPVGLALSDDGRRVAVLTAEGGTYALRGYIFSTTSLGTAFQRTGAGVPRALAASGDLSRMLVVGQFAEGNFTYGGGKLFPFAQSDPLASFLDSSANNTDARGAAMSLDGSVSVIGGADGRLHVFRGARDQLAAPAILSLGAGALANLSMSDDGSRLASTAGTVLTLVDLAPATPRALWNATLGGQAATLASLDRTGSLIVVGSSGTGGALYGFSDADATPLWSVPGDTRAVAVDSAGTRLAYALHAAVSGARIAHALTMDLAGGGTILPQQTVTAPGELTVAVTLRNDGAAMEHVVFEATSPDVNVTSTPVVVKVRPGAILPVNLSIAVSAGVTSPRTFEVTARSLSSGLTDTVTISIAPRPTLDVKLFLNETDVLAEPGRPSVVLLAVVNNGTGDANVAIRATQTVSAGPQWNLTLSDTSLAAIRGTRQPITVTMTPPADVANGTAATVVFTLQGQDIFDTARITYRVNPELRVDVQAAPPTRYVVPGERAAYNVTIVNTGSLPRDFSIFFEIGEDSDRQWGVDLDAQTVRLEPKARKVLPLTITAPANALPDERVGVRIAVRSIAEPGVVNDTIVNESAEVFAIAIPRPVTTPTKPTNDVPAPAPFVAAASIALLALLLRRRRT